MCNRCKSTEEKHEKKMLVCLYKNKRIVYVGNIPPKLKSKYKLEQKSGHILTTY